MYANTKISDFEESAWWCKSIILAFGKVKECGSGVQLVCYGQTGKHKTLSQKQTKETGKKFKCLVLDI